MTGGGYSHFHHAGKKTVIAVWELHQKLRLPGFHLGVLFLICLSFCLKWSLFLIRHESEILYPKLNSFHLFVHSVLWNMYDTLDHQSIRVRTVRDCVTMDICKESKIFLLLAPGLLRVPNPSAHRDYGIMEVKQEGWVGTASASKVSTSSLRAELPPWPHHIAIT